MLRAVIVAIILAAFVTAAVPAVAAPNGGRSSSDAAPDPGDLVTDWVIDWGTGVVVPGDGIDGTAAFEIIGTGSPRPIGTEIVMLPRHVPVLPRQGLGISVYVDASQVATPNLLYLYLNDQNDNPLAQNPTSLPAGFKGRWSLPRYLVPKAGVTAVSFGFGFANGVIVKSGQKAKFSAPRLLISDAAPQ